MLGRKFWRVRYTIPVALLIVTALGFWYWSSDGEILTGGVEYRPESIVFPTKYVTDKGTVELRATWTRTGQDSYRAEESQRAGEDWKPLWTMELKRAR